MRQLNEWQQAWNRQTASGKWDKTPLDMWEWIGDIYYHMTPEEQAEDATMAGLELDQLTPDKNC
jgi:hypothetical protein